MDTHTEYVWHPPQYYVSGPPTLESSLQLENDPEYPENFTRAAKWCPDGSAFLTQNEDRTFQLFTVPSTTIQPTEVHPPLVPCLPSKVLPQPAAILDFIWYPTASFADLSSFCFVASVRECPVKLLDATDGRLRASYRIVDHRERHIAPHSLTFNLSAERLYCGFEDAIEVFDVSRPGEGTRIPTTPSKKSKDGLKGIISALAFVPSQGSDMYAAGSLSPMSSNTAMFSEIQGPEPVMFVSGGPSSAVTQIHFNPVQPHIMYAAYRRHSNIYSWDLRGNMDTPITIYNCSEPSGRTNQKIRFDIDLGGNWLSSGDQSGNISVFDLQVSDDPSESTGDDTWAQTQTIHPKLTFNAHRDAIGSVAFHPLRPTLLSASGSRHFEDSPATDSSDSSISDDIAFSSDTTGYNHPPTKRTRRNRPHPIILDSSIKLWTFSGKAAQFETKS